MYLTIFCTYSTNMTYYAQFNDEMGLKFINIYFLEKLYSSTCTERSFCTFGDNYIHTYS